MNARRTTRWLQTMLLLYGTCFSRLQTCYPVQRLYSSTLVEEQGKEPRHNMYILMYARARENKYVLTYARARTHTHTYTGTHAHVHTQRHARTCTHKRMHAHAHTDTHTSKQLPTQALTHRGARSYHKNLQHTTQIRQIIIVGQRWK